MKPAYSGCLILLFAVAAVAGPAPLDDLASALRIFAEDAVHVYTSPFRMTDDQALRLGGLTIVAGTVFAYDQQVHDGLRDVRFDQPFRPLHEYGEWTEPVGFASRTNKYYFAGLAFSYTVGWNRGVTVLAEVIEAQLIGGIGMEAMQWASGRQRPYGNKGPYAFGVENATSLPSGHAMNITQLATILSHHMDRKAFTWFAWTTALAVNVQRTNSRMHWPSDVIVAAVHGYAVARDVLRRHEARGWHPWRNRADTGWRAEAATTPAGPGLALVRRF